MVRSCPASRLILFLLFKKKVIGLEKAAGAKLDITEAEIVVAAGRGIKGPDNFKILEALAEVLNASVEQPEPPSMKAGGIKRIRSGRAERISLQNYTWPLEFLGRSIISWDRDL